MTAKILIGSLSLIARPLGSSRTLAWYAQRRLGRA
jgi:hypothetical protein